MVSIVFGQSLDINNMFQDWLSGKRHLSSWIKCRNCSTSSCFGCDPVAFVKQSRFGAQDKQVSWCCASGRLFLIWMLLCGFDQHYCAGGSREPAKTKSSRQTQIRGNTKVKTNKKTWGGGIGFGSNHRHSMSYMPSGMGYGSDSIYYGDLGDHLDDSSPFSSKGKGHTLDPRLRPIGGGKSVAQNAQEIEDKFNRTILELLSGLLPSLDRETGFDVDPQRLWLICCSIAIFSTFVLSSYGTTLWTTLRTERPLSCTLELSSDNWYARRCASDTV